MEAKFGSVKYSNGEQGVVLSYSSDTHPVGVARPVWVLGTNFYWSYCQRSTSQRSRKVSLNR